ncbi:MAG: hypothetical protein AMXMBFR78_04020 [Rubrivivax sp.]
MDVNEAGAADLADYYRRRAASYERVYHKPERQADLRAMEAWVRERFAGRRVLEIACGTGWWTPHGAREARSWLATDLEPETMAIARAKAMPPTVEFARLDAYALDGLDEMDARSFDAAFAGFWWSHVPLQRLAGWVGTLHARLAPGARVVVLDNRFVAGSSTPLTRRDAHGNTYQQRSLDDGSTHEVLKNFPDAQALRTVLGEAATDFAWTAWTHYWAATWTVAGSGVGPAGV